MNAPKVAVILCTYNMAKYLPECLNSVLALKYPDLQVVVVDDGSTDETEALVGKKYSNQVLYVRQENNGLFSARNTGISKVQNVDYYSIVDADDIVHPLKVWDEVAYLERFSDAVICFSNMVDFHDGSDIGEIVWPVNRLLEEEQEWGNMKKIIEKIVRYYAYTSICTIRGSAFHKIGGYDDTLKCSGDLDLAIRLSRRGSTGFIGKPRYLRRRFSESMTLSMKRRIVQIMRIFDKIWLNSSEFSDEEKWHLRRMEQTFLMMSLWGTAFGTVDNDLTEMISQRLKNMLGFRDQLKVKIISLLRTMHLARPISHLRSNYTHKKNLTRQIKLQHVLDDLSACFNDVEWNHKQK